MTTTRSVKSQDPRLDDLRQDLDALIVDDMGLDDEIRLVIGDSRKCRVEMEEFDVVSTRRIQRAYTKTILYLRNIG